VINQLKLMIVYIVASEQNVFIIINKITAKTKIRFTFLFNELQQVSAYGLPCRVQQKYKQSFFLPI